MKINLRSITVMLGLLAVVSILVPTQTQIFASTDTEPRQLDIEEVGDEDNNAEMLLMTIKEGNQKSEQVDDFQLTPDNALFVEVGKNVQVTDDENFFRAVVTDTKDKDKQIPISQQGVVNLAGLAQGAYTLDVVIQDGNRKIAYEAVLFIGPDNTQNRDTVNKEVERVNKDVTIIKKTTNIDNIVKCGKDQKFNEKTQKCVNIPPPCKPNEVRDKAGKCIPKPPTKTPTPPSPTTPIPAPGQPGPAPGAGTAGSAGSVGSSCNLPGGGSGKITNTPDGPACVGAAGAGTTPPPAGGTPAKPVTPEEPTKPVTPTKTPTPPPGGAGTPTKVPPGWTQISPFQFRTPQGNVVTLFPEGTQKEVPCPQFSGKQCVKFPNGKVVPVEGLIEPTEFPGRFATAGAPSLTGSGGPLDPNNPVGTLFPACPPGGSDVECIPGPPLPGQPIAPPKGQTPTPIPGTGPTGPGVTRTPGDTTAPLPDLTPTPTPEPTGPGVTRTPGDTTAPLPDLTPTPEPEVPGIPEPNVCDDPANADLPECQDVPPTPIIEPGRTDGTQGAPVTPPTDTEEPIPDPTPTPEPTPTTEPEEVDPVEPTEEICADPANAALPECGGPTTGEPPREDVRPMPLGEEPPIAELPTEDPGVETEPPLEEPTPAPLPDETQTLPGDTETEPTIPEPQTPKEDTLFGDDPAPDPETEGLVQGGGDAPVPEPETEGLIVNGGGGAPGAETEREEPGQPPQPRPDPIPEEPVVVPPMDTESVPEPPLEETEEVPPTPPIDPCLVDPTLPDCNPVDPPELDCGAQGMEEEDGQCVLPEPEPVPEPVPELEVPQEEQFVPQEQFVPDQGFETESDGGEGGDTGDSSDTGEGGEGGDSGDGDAGE